MTDVHSQSVRKKNMRAIKSKNTLPELLVRKSLHAHGFRFRLHADYLPGKPDIVLPKYRTAIFVHGCFWHGHSCKYFKVPDTRPEFWLTKIEGNRKRDKINTDKITGMGWNVMVIWECAIKADTPGLPGIIGKIRSCLESHRTADGPSLNAIP